MHFLFSSSFYWLPLPTNPRKSRWSDVCACCLLCVKNVFWNDNSNGKEAYAVDLKYSDWWGCIIRRLLDTFMLLGQLLSNDVKRFADWTNVLSLYDTHARERKRWLTKSDKIPFFKVLYITKFVVFIFLQFINEPSFLFHTLMQRRVRTTRKFARVRSVFKTKHARSFPSKGTQHFK